MQTIWYARQRSSFKVWGVIVTLVLVMLATAVPTVASASEPAPVSEPKYGDLFLRQVDVGPLPVRALGEGADPEFAPLVDIPAELLVERDSEDLPITGRSGSNDAYLAGEDATNLVSAGDVLVAFVPTDLDVVSVEVSTETDAAVGAEEVPEDVLSMAFHLEGTAADDLPGTAVLDVVEGSLRVGMGVADSFAVGGSDAPANAESSMLERAEKLGFDGSILGYDPGLLNYSEPLAVISAGNAQVDVLVPGQADDVQAAVNDGSARFDELLPGVALDVDAIEGGVKFTYELTDFAASEEPLYEAVRFGEGWSAIQDSELTINLVDEDSELVMGWSGGPVVDAVGAETVATLRLISQGDGVAVAEVVVDEEWLSADGRVWPVRIDPQVTSDGSQYATRLRSTFGDQGPEVMVDGVHAATGNFTFARSDAAVTSIGPGLAVERTYNSLDGDVGPFGIGWSWNFDTRIEGQWNSSQGVVLVRPDGSSKSFALADYYPSADWVDNLLLRRWWYIDGSHGGWSVETNDGRLMRFNADGELRTVEDANGNELRLHRFNGRVHSIEDVVSGREIRLGWTNNLVTSVELDSPDGQGVRQVASYEYVGNRLVKACDAIGACEHYQWIESLDVISGIRDAITPLDWSANTSIFYDPFTDRVGAVERRPEHTVNGNKHTFDYIVGEAFGDNTASGGNTMSIVTDPRGNEIGFTFNADAQPLVRSVPNIGSGGGATGYAYDDQGRKRQVTVPQGDGASDSGTLVFTYDSAGRIATETNAAGNTRRYQYDSLGNLTHDCPALAMGDLNSPYCARHSYVGTNRTKTTQTLNPTKLSDSVWEWEYNTRGQVELSRDPLGRETTFEYFESNSPIGSRGDLKSVTYPDGSRRSYEYNGWGQITAEFHAEVGEPSELVGINFYGTRGELVKTVGPATTNAITGKQHQLQTDYIYNNTRDVFRRYEFDSYDRPGTLRTFEYHYDRSGREIRSLAPAYLDPLGNEITPEITREFDANGNVVLVCDANQNARLDIDESLNADSVCTVTTFDARNRPTSTKTAGIVQSTMSYYDDGQLRTIQDANNNVTWFGYDEGGRLVLELLRGASDSKWTIVERREYQFGGDSVLASYEGGIWGSGPGETKVGLKETEFVYDFSGNVYITKEIDPFAQRWTKTEYLADGNVDYVEVSQGAESIKTAFMYDSMGNLRSTVEDVGGLNIERLVSSDSTGVAESVTDANQNTTFFTQDGAGRTVQMTAPLTDVYSDNGQQPTSGQAEVTTGHDAFGNVTHVRDALGRVTETVYDSHDRIAIIHQPEYTQRSTGVKVNAYEQFWYDPNGNLVRERDRLGDVSLNEFDGFNRAIFRVDPPSVLGDERRITRFWYDDNGNVTKVRDPSGAIRRWTYNMRNQPLTETVEVRSVILGDESARSAGEYTTTNTYNSLGHLTAVETPLGLTTTYEYDAFGRLQYETAPGGDNHRYLYHYDILDNLVRVDLPGGGATVTVYDAAGRLIETKELGIDGSQISGSTFTHDDNGNVLTEVTQGGVETSFVYDDANRLTSSAVISVSPAITASFGYDLVGNLAYFEDGRGNVTTYITSEWGQEEEIYHPPTASSPQPAQRRMQTDYNAAGQVERTTASGADVRFTYDTAGRLLREADSSGAVWREFDYDRAGNMVATRSNGAAETTFLYDDRGLLLESDGAAGRSAFDYDADGRMTSRYEPGPVGGVSLFGYTDRNELASYNDRVSGETANIEWNNRGQIERAEIGSDAVREYFYGADGRLERESFADGAVLQTSNVYTYDGHGNVNSENRYDSEMGWTRTFYNFDNANRLTRFREKPFDPPVRATAVWNYDETYTYDEAGNRIRQVTVDDRDGGDGQTVATWDYNERNQIETSSEEGTYKWSHRGTLMSITGNDGQIKAYTFDALGQMSNAEGVAYKYDGLGRLANRDENGQSQFLYSGLTRDPTFDGETTYGRSPFGELISLKNESTNDRRLVGLDRFGDVRFLASPDGSLTESINYNPFGEVHQRSGDDADPNVGFQGDWTDPVTGDVHLDARWYSPTSGTFNSRDSYGGELSSSVSLNRYTYGNNNPIRYWDPSGFASTPCTGLSNSACHDKFANLGPAVPWYVLEWYDDWSASNPNTATSSGPACGVGCSVVEQSAAVLPAPVVVPSAVPVAVSAPVQQQAAASVVPAEAAAAEVAQESEPFSFGDVLIGGKDAGLDNVSGFIDTARFVGGCAAAALQGRVCDQISEAIQAVQLVVDRVQEGEWRAVITEIAVGLVPPGCFDRGLDYCLGYVAVELLMNTAAPGGVLAKVTRALDALPSAPTGNRLAHNNGGASCALRSFSGDTEVLMADGSHVEFEDLAVGDEVWATDPETGESGGRSVLAVWPHFDATMEFAVGDDVVVTTEDHPFWNATDSQWQWPMHFDLGDEVLTPSGELVQTGGLDWATVEGGTAYDMTVEGLHTFYVAAGDVDVLVHNCGNDAPSGARVFDFSRASVNTHGTDLVESHLLRFADDGALGSAEAGMLDRLRRISTGDLAATDYDLAFYTHELRELTLYRQAGYTTGQPSSGAYEFWDALHTQALSDYGFTRAQGPHVLYHPSVQ